MRRLLILLAAAALTVSAGVLPALAVVYPHTTGTWYSDPAQTSTTTTTTTTSTAYKTAVRGAVNPDGSSNFSGKKGVVAVQFDLLAAPSTTTTTTTTYAPIVWESNHDPFTYTVVGLSLSPTLTFNDIQNLSAIYQFDTGDCFGGSLRWDIYLSSAPGVIHVYYGDPNNLAATGNQSCSGIYSESGKNLMSQTDVTLPASRFEIGNTGAYTTYDAAVAATGGGTATVTGAQLTLDSGWHADQRATVSDITVNDNTWVPKTTESTSSTVTGDFAKTCDLPQAELRWAQNDPVPDGAINEGESIQPKDTGQFYRNVDCKYIYNLDVTSLSGKGTYYVYARINGQNLQVPAKFDLK